mmetsp:Transcript_37695/g.82472  ORF Transcript_37695/g.82472 Transcript_37695/m.82472 type:complete len:359 (-) Transcript_37695:1524-2600(-)
MQKKRRRKQPNVQNCEANACSPPCSKINAEFSAASPPSSLWGSHRRCLRVQSHPRRGKQRLQTRAQHLSGLLAETARPDLQLTELVAEVVQALGDPLVVTPNGTIHKVLQGLQLGPLLVVPEVQLALQASLRLSDSLSHHIPNVSVVVLVVPSLLLLHYVHSLGEVSSMLADCLLNGGANGPLQLEILFMVSLRLLLAEFQEILLGLGNARMRLCNLGLQLIDVRIDHLGLAIHCLLGLNRPLVIVVRNLTNDSLAPQQHLLRNRLLCLRNQLCGKPMLHVAFTGDLGAQCLSLKRHCTFHSGDCVHHIIHFRRQTRNRVVHDHIHLLLMVITLQLVGLLQPPDSILQSSLRFFLQLV